MMHRQPKLLTERDMASSGPRALKDPGSVEYAWQTVSHLKLMFQLAELSVKDWQAAVADAEQHRIYERIPPENPYGTLDAMLVAEIGETVATSTASVMSRATNVLPLARHGEVGNGRSRGSVTTSTQERGADYLTARIARDHPAILDRMKAGEYRSVRAAADDAGLVKKRVSIPLDPAKAARLIRKHFAVEQVAALIEALSSPEVIQ